MMIHENDERDAEDQVKERGAFANIPPKDFRRIATRYDRLATNFLAAVCIAAPVSYWL
jgi:transposase